jgi:hypothetical protein
LAEAISARLSGAVAGDHTHAIGCIIGCIETSNRSGSIRHEIVMIHTSVNP